METGDIYVSKKSGNAYMVTDDVTWSHRPGDVGQLKVHKLVCIMFVRTEFVEHDEEMGVDFKFTQRGQCLFCTEALLLQLIKYNDFNPSAYIN